MSDILQRLGGQIQQARRSRGLSQAELAARVGRDRARISEFERDLASNRLGRDRLTLLVEICDALDLIPVLVARARAGDLEQAAPDAAPRRQSAARAFDDLFVDLDDEGED